MVASNASSDDPDPAPVKISMASWPTLGEDIARSAHILALMVRYKNLWQFRYSDSTYLFDGELVTSTLDLAWVFHIKGPLGLAEYILFLEGEENDD